MKSTNRRCNPACACADALRWLDANGHSLAPLTGTSGKALRAVAHLWQLYAYTRDPAVVVAVRSPMNVTPNPSPPDMQTIQPPDGGACLGIMIAAAFGLCIVCVLIAFANWIV